MNKYSPEKTKLLFYFLADLISTIEFNEDGELLAVGDKGGRIVVFQREQQVRKERNGKNVVIFVFSLSFVDKNIATSE